LEARVFSYNPASARILEKNGFYFEALTKAAYSKEGKYYDGLAYTTLNDEVLNNTVDYVDRK